MELFTLGKTPYNGEPALDGNGNGKGLKMLLRRLEILRLEAGRPTYRQISRASGLSASTICRIFNATKPPTWDNLTRVLAALGTEPNISWREWWINAENDSDPIPVELGAGLTAPGRQHCPACGAWIADTTAHETHHQQLDAMATTIEELRWQIAALAATRSKIRTEDDQPAQPPEISPQLSLHVRPRKPVR